jgi:hypothetical protein
MRIFRGDMFTQCKSGDALCVTTNGIITNAGKLVMGAGVALEFRNRFAGIDAKLAGYVSKYGNRVFRIGKANISGKEVMLFSFPTKHHWKEQSDLKLIEQSCIQLKEVVEKFKIQGDVYLPAPGCGNGGLNWEIDVKSTVLKHLADDKYIICFRN